LWTFLVNWHLNILGHDLGYNVSKYLGLIYGADGTGFIVLFIVFAVIVALDGLALWRLKPWARLLAMLIALPLMLILLGLVVLWVLLKPEVKQLFGVEATEGAPPAAVMPKPPKKTKEDAAAQEQQREEKDSERLAAVKALVEASNEIAIDELAGALEISRDALARNVSEWSKDLGIKIKGDSVLIAPSDITDFLDRLAEDMESWPR
jgi:uncharacterized membrane protein YqjE